jgi:hypothetical protein
MLQRPMEKPKVVEFAALSGGAWTMSPPCMQGFRAEINAARHWSCKARTAQKTLKGL